MFKFLLEYSLSARDNTFEETDSLKTVTSYP